MIITIFFEFLFMMMSGILGIIIGHKSNNLKLVKSIIIGFITYMMLSAISVVILYIAGLLNPDIMLVFSSMDISSNALKDMMIVGVISVFLFYVIKLAVTNAIKEYNNEKK